MSQAPDSRTPLRSCPIHCPLRSGQQDTETPFPNPPSDLPWTLSEAAKRLYTPIKDWQTRLLILEPGKPGAVLKGQLVEVNIIQRSGVVINATKERQAYSALSYTWGAPEFSRSIELDGVLLPITNNLYTFLQQYRKKPSFGMALWIDAICINQLDLKEKAIQVTNLLIIFEKAENVVVWLGEGGRRTNLAIEYAEWINTRDVDGGWTTPDLVHSRHCEENADAVIQGLQDLTTRDWISRIWVRQEIWAASTVFVMCGSSTVKWETFRLCAELCTETLTIGDNNAFELDKTTRQLTPSISEDKYRALTGLKCSSDRKFSLIFSDISLYEDTSTKDMICRLIDQSSHCQYSDPLDRIYALLGMTSITTRTSGDADDRTSFTIDYGCSEAMVFCHLARWVVLNLGVSALLNSVATFGSSGHLHLPSWTPNWNLPLRPSSFIKSQNTTFELEELHRANPVPYSHELVVTGYIIAELTTLDLSAVKTSRDGCLLSVFGPVFRSPRDLGAEFMDDSCARTFSCRWTSCVSWPNPPEDNDEIDSGNQFIRELEDYVLNQKPVLACSQARATDLVVGVITARGAIVLRPIEEAVGTYTYVGCAWFGPDQRRPWQRTTSDFEQHLSFPLDRRRWEKQTFRLI